MATSPIILTDNDQPRMQSGLWLDVLKFYGLGTLLAIGFFIWLTRSVDAKLDANIDAARTNGVALAKHDTNHDIHEARAQAIQEQALRTLVALCRNSATTRREAELCGAAK